MAQSPLARYRMKNFQLVENVQYMEFNEFPVYADLGNKYGTQFYLVKHERQTQSGNDQACVFNRQFIIFLMFSSCNLFTIVIVVTGFEGLFSFFVYIYSPSNE